MKHIFSRLTFIFLLVLLPAFSADALTISPVRLEISVAPGETYSGNYKLINDDEMSRTYYSSFENFESQGETGSPKFTQEKKGLTEWISGPKITNLNPSSTQSLPFSITVPEDAVPGGYFGVIFWGNSPTEDEEGQPIQFQVNSKIGILVLLTVEGFIEEDAQVLEFETLQGSLLSTTPMNFYYRFQNGGGDRVRPEGFLTIRNMFGGETMKIDANPTNGNVLPRQVRRYELDWIEGETPQGFFGKVSHQLKNFHLGRYKAHLDVTFGAEENEIHDVKVFWIIPWQLIVSLLVILVVVGGGGRRLLQGYKKRILAESQK